MKLEEAMFNARLHLEKGTLLSDEAVREVCRALVESDGQEFRAFMAGMHHGFTEVGYPGLLGSDDEEKQAFTDWKGGR